MNCELMTYTGKLVDVANMRQGDIAIEDIAHALACTNRFGGHLREPVSVAQHSVVVSYLAAQHPLQGLLHDASEAYLGDVVGPLKNSPMLEKFVKLDARVQLMIYAKFKCPLQVTPDVIQADQLALRIEAWKGYQKPFRCEPPTAAEEREVRQHFSSWFVWNWREAEEQFLKRFKELTT